MALHSPFWTHILTPGLHGPASHRPVLRSSPSCDDKYKHNMAPVPVESLLISALEPLSLAALHPRALARLACCSRGLRDALYGAEDCWAATAAARELPNNVRSRHAYMQFCGTHGLWCEETTFGAVITQGNSVKLQLGSGQPQTTRVAAVNSLVALASSCTVEFSMSGCAALVSSGANLWLGVMYNRTAPHETLDRASTRVRALAGYETAAANLKGKGKSLTQSIAERFGANAAWVMSALGSHGAVWSDGEVKLTPFRFGGSSTAAADATVFVQMHVDLDRNELRYSMPSDASMPVPTPKSSLTAVRRLIPRSLLMVGPRPRLYIVAQLTDVHRPVTSRTTASVNVVWNSVCNL